MTRPAGRPAPEDARQATLRGPAPPSAAGGEGLLAAAAAALLRPVVAAPVAPCVKEGAVVVFDARCLHRGLPNRTAPRIPPAPPQSPGPARPAEGRARAVLIFR